MQYKDTVTINAPRDKVWAFLIDANKVAPCAPGVESVEVIEENKKYKVIASVGFGNLKVKFDGDLEFLSLVEPDFAKIKGHGTAPGSAADAIAEMKLTDTDDGNTLLSWSADITVMGTIASLANRMMGSVTKKLAAEFFTNVKQNIEE